MIEWSKYFTYDEASGHLVWNRVPVEDFKTRRAAGRFAGMFAGKVAGWEEWKSDGRKSAIRVSLKGKQYLAHRIIWEMKCGLVPPGMVVDHVDGNPFNNKWSNFRLATYSQNAMNARRHKKNKTGHKGVSVSNGRFIAYITKNYQNMRLGTYRTIEEAIAARKSAVLIHHGEFAPQ